MSDSYQEELKRQQTEQRKLEETMQRHPKTKQRDEQLKTQLEWLNKQET